jgi:hypothetical protein
MNVGGHGHSFGDTDGWNSAADVVRDNSHHAATSGQLNAIQHPAERCDPNDEGGGDGLPD